jgi:putative toxin-antitoxin system antitoxin component (TIGR02293 family)
MVADKMDAEKKLDKKIAFLVKKAKAKKASLFMKTDVSTFETFLSNRLLVINIIQQGVPYALFNIVQDYTPFEMEDWLIFLDISSKTLMRYKESEKTFRPIQSEKIIEMAEVTHTGLGVFGNMEKFKLWLNTPNFSLGKSKPMDLLKSSYGKDLVLAELTHINHGILA